MEISYFGHSCFRIKTKEAIIIIDPFSDEVGMRLPKLTADIVCCSHQHSDHSDLSQISNEPFVISAPGEYEIKNVSIIGLATWHDEAKGAERGRNTVYVLEAEGCRLCHLGDLGHALSDSECDLIGSLDALMVPVGGQVTIDNRQAAAVVAKLEPRLVLPMHFKTKETSGYIKNQTGLEEFLQEMNGTQLRQEKKLKLSASALAETETEIIVLERSK